MKTKPRKFFLEVLIHKFICLHLSRRLPWRHLTVQPFLYVLPSCPLEGADQGAVNLWSVCIQPPSPVHTTYHKTGLNLSEYLNFAVEEFLLSGESVPHPQIPTGEGLTIQDPHTQCTFEIVCTREGTFNFWALEVTEDKKFA